MSKNVDKSGRHTTSGSIEKFEVELEQRFLNNLIGLLRKYRVEEETACREAKNILYGAPIHFFSTVENNVFKIDSLKTKARIKTKMPLKLLIELLSFNEVFSDKSKIRYMTIDKGGVTYKFRSKEVLEQFELIFEKFRVDFKGDEIYNTFTGKTERPPNSYGKYKVLIGINSIYHKYVRFSIGIAHLRDLISKFITPSNTERQINILTYQVLSTMELVPHYKFPNKKNFNSMNSYIKKHLNWIV